jgi:ribonuclease HI
MSDDAKWVLHFDRSSNRSLGSRAGIILRDPKGKLHRHQRELSRGSTCNQAEYSALLIGIEEAKKLGMKI